MIYQISTQWLMLYHIST